jgi:hypothetical protein
MLGTGYQVMFSNTGVVGKVSQQNLVGDIQDSNRAVAFTNMYPFHKPTLPQTIATVPVAAPAFKVMNGEFVVSKTASSGLDVVITATGVCIVKSGGLVTATIAMTGGTGTCRVHYNQPGNAIYDVAPEVVEDTTAQKAEQTISLTLTPPSEWWYHSTFPASATSNSGLAVTIGATGSCCPVNELGSCIDNAIVSASVYMTAPAGTCTVTYTQAGDLNYNAAGTLTRDTTARKGNQEITVTQGAPGFADDGSSFGVAATSTSGLGVAIATTGVCSVTAGGTGTATIHVTSGIGTCTVHYTQIGNTNYNAAQEVTEDTTAVIVRQNQTVSVSTHAPSSAGYNTSFPVVASSSSGLPVAISTSGSCSGSGTGSATILMTSGTGNCTVHYDQAGNMFYNTAPRVDETVAAQKVDQSISVTAHAPASAPVNGTFQVTATATSGLGVAIAGSGACSGGGTGSATITMNAASGSCTVAYSQAGNGNYNVAPPVSDSTSATKIDQTIDVTTHAPGTKVYNGTFGVVANASSGLGVAITSSGACSGGGTGSATITMTSGTGTCTVAFDQVGNSIYEVAPQVTEGTAAQKATQSIAVTTHAPSTAVINSTFPVAATANSGLGVAIAGSGACSGGGTGSATITMTSGTGTCTVAFSQSGNNNYSAATPASETTAAQKIAQTVTVTTHAPAGAAIGTTFNVAATASSSLGVAITSSGACSGSGSGTATITMNSGTGTCSVYFDQAGNATYGVAPRVTETVAARSVMLTQNILVTTHAPATAGCGGSFPVAASASSALGVAITSSGSCSGGGTDSATITMTSATGSCTVAFNQSGSADYNPASEVTESAAGQKGAQAITVTTHAPSDAGYGTIFPVAATASSNLGVSIATSGVCNGSGTGSANVTVTSTSGTCTTAYSQAGNACFNPASPVTEVTTAHKADQTITITTPAPADAVYGTTFTVAATSSSPLAVAITATGACSVSSGGSGVAVIRMNAGTGICTVHYNQAGSTYYNPAPEKTEDATALRLSQTVDFAALQDRVYGDPAPELAATASSGLPITYSTLTPLACNVDGAAAELLGAGTCSIRACQDGNETYQPDCADQSFTVLLAVDVLASKDSPQALAGVGTVRFTLQAAGGSGNYEYQVRLYSFNALSGQYEWQTVREYTGGAGSNIWDWNPAEVGAYTLEFGARMSIGTPAENFAAMDYYVVQDAPVTSLTLDADKPSPQPLASVGTVRFTAEAGGSAAPEYQFLFCMVDPDSGACDLQPVQGYGGGPLGNTWDWTPTELGSYEIQVLARTQGSIAPYEQTASMSFDVREGFVARFTSSGPYDGWVLEKSENSSVGGSINAGYAVVKVGDDPYKRQYRTILSFNTAAIPDGALIHSATLKLRHKGLVGANPFATHGNLLVDVTKGAFSNGNALQKLDFQAAATMLEAGTIDKTPVSTWYSGTFPGSVVNSTGVTQVRLRFAADDNNDRKANTLLLFSGNAPAASRPVLEVLYFVP